jgi:hypothetical protein
MWSETTLLRSLPACALCVVCCGGAEPERPGTSGGASAEASGGTFVPSGPNEPGESVPATPAPDPFADAGAFDSGKRPEVPCDDARGDPSPCAAPDGATCLTATLCQSLEQSLLPRSAGFAMACIANLDDCAPGVLGDCFVQAAQLACAPAATGTPPCDAVANACGAADPFGAVDHCLSAASAFSPAAATALQTCIASVGECDPDVLGACAATLLP